MPFRIRYRHRTRLPREGSMHPKYGRKRVLRRLFTCMFEQSRVRELLEEGANPLSVRKGIPLFWYRAFSVGGLQWLETSGLDNEQLARPATMPDGSKRTLFEQVTLEPLSLRHLLGRGIGKRFSQPTRGIARRDPGGAHRKPTYDEIAAYLVSRGAAHPSRELVACLLQRDWPVMRTCLEAMLLTEGAPLAQAAGEAPRRL